MTYRGRVKGGVVVLDSPAVLPEGLEVEVQPRVADAQPKTIYERLRSVIGSVEGPADLARNHDHYAHGTPKQEA